MWLGWVIYRENINKIIVHKLLTYTVATRPATADNELNMAHSGQYTGSGLGLRLSRANPYPNPSWSLHQKYVEY